MLKQKNIFLAVKKVISIFVGVTTVLWSLGLAFLPPVQAASGYNFRYINDGGSTPDVFLNNAAIPELVLGIEAFESQGANNRITGITLEIMDSMGTGGQMSGFTNADLSQVSLYLDTDANGSFSTSADTLLASSSPANWLIQTNPTRWRSAFSGLSVPIPAIYSMNSTSTIFVVAQGTGAAINGSSTKSFNFQIPSGGVQVSVGVGASLTNFPAAGGPMGSVYFSPKVNLGQEGTGGFGSPIVISEIQTNGATNADDFVELFNRSPAAPMNLNGYKLLFYQSSATNLQTPDQTLVFSSNNGTTTIPGNGFLLISNIGYDGAITRDLNYNFDIANSGIVVLTDAANAVVDKLGYGSLTTVSLSEGGQAAPAPSVNGSIERKAFPDSTLSKMQSGGIHASQGNGEDTTNNALDFIVRTTSEPQNSGSSVESMGGGIGSQGTPIVINEVFYNAASSTGWIELYNRKTDNPNFNVAGWKLITNGKTYTIPSNAATQAMPSGGFMIVHWNAVGTNTTTTAGTQAHFYTGISNWNNMGIYGGDVILKTGADEVKDYIQYGGSGMSNETVATSSGQWTAGDFALGCLYGQSIGRRTVSGDDYNSSADWQTYTTPSSGYPNMGGDSTAPSKVTNVTLTDIDSASGSGLNGRDITITWTPDPTPDNSFNKYAIYLLPSGTPIDTEIHSPVEQIYGGQYQYIAGVASTTYAYTGASFITKDSANNNLATGNYVAYVMVEDMAGNQSVLAMSSSAALTSEAYDVGNDNQAPFIMHMAVWQAQVGQNLVLVARVEDDRSLGANVPQVVWKVGTDSSVPNLTSGATATNCVLVESNYYTCTIAWNGSWNSTSVIGYYLKAQDERGNIRYMSASPEADMQGSLSLVQANPFLINFLTADADPLGDYQDSDASADLSGNVYQPNGSVFANGQQPYVYLEGTAIGTFRADDTTGAFTIPDNKLIPGSFRLIAFKEGYMDMMKDVFRGDSSINIYLNQGIMLFGKGGGEMPMVTWTAPNDGMMGSPRNIFCTSDCSQIGAGETPVVIGFSKEMNANTINDQDAANADSNIYLTSNGQDRVAGKVKYVYNPPSTNEARFYASAQNSLNSNTLYSIVVTQGVTDTTGNPISGGAGQGGAFVNGFTTMMDNANLWGTGWQNYQEGGANFGEQMGGGGAGFAGMNFSQYGQSGAMMPPYVRGTVPQAGAFNIDRNRAVLIEFSEPMNSSSITNTTVKLFPITNETNWTEGSAVSATVFLDLTTQKIVTLTPASNLDLNTANHGWYILKVMGGVKSAAGVWLGDPRNCGATNPDTCLATQSSYTASFQLNSSASGDATSPTVLGTYPNNNDGIIAGTQAVEVGIPAIEVAFSEPMLPSTINAQNFILKAGSSSGTGKVLYDPTGNSARFIPNSALQANTQYTLTIATTTQDLSGRGLAAAQVIKFKTGGADTTSPEILYANADDYTIAVTFSKAMNSAKQTDVDKWGTSVLNPANYYIKGLAMISNQMTPVLPYASETGMAGQPLRLNASSSAAQSLKFSYDESTNTVMVEGFIFNSQEPHATDYQLFLQGARDKSNNIIADNGGWDVNARNAKQGPIQSSAQTFGMLGPGGPGMMMMGSAGGGGGPMGPGGGGGMSMGPGMNMGTMGIKRAGAMPMNMGAGQTSLYFVDVPITSQILSGGKIILTFPTGFNVASVQQDLYSPKNKDFNEWGSGTITFACSDASKNCAGGATATGDGAADSTKAGSANDGIIANTSARAVTILLNGNTQANDFLHFDLKGIVNSTVPKEFGTDGYNVDIKTMSPAGVLLENISTMPFYLTQGGNITISGIVSATQGNGATPLNIDNGQTMTVFLGSPMTGPMETDITFTGGSTTTYSFTGLTAGEYNLFTDPNITLSSGGVAYSFEGLMMPEPLRVTASTSKNLLAKRQDTNSGSAVLVTLKGNFTSSGIADDVDVFANSPSGFRVKTFQDVGNVGSTGTTTTLYLPDGRWMVGMGPAMPKGPMSGPAKMPDWMPPNSVDIEISSGAYKENSGTANDGTIVFNLTSQQSYQILGKVVDDGGTGIADTEVFGFNPMGGFGGSNSKTDTGGNFTLKIGALGAYKVGAHKPGLPDAQEMTVDVRADGTYLGDTRITTSSQFQLKMKKPAYTISGKVLNVSSQAIAYTPVWAYKTTGWGNAKTMTDSSGNYILYVDSGTWNVETDAPGMGWLRYDLPVVIATSSQANINLKPSADATFVDISGTVTIAGSAQQYMPIRAVEYNINGNYLGKEFSSLTDSNGAYTITVPGTGSADTYKYYRVDIWTPFYGEVERTGTDDVANNPANTRVANADKAGVDITVASANLKNVQIAFTNGSSYSTNEGFLMIDGVTFSNNIPKPTGFHKSLRITDLSATTTIQLQTGDYFFFVDIPGKGSYMPNAASKDATKQDIVVGAAGATVVFDLPSLSQGMITITANITDGNVALKDAWFWVGSPSGGFHTGCSTNVQGACSLNVPKLSSGSYMIGADKPSYMSAEPVSDSGATSTTHSIILSRQAYVISGYIYAESDGVSGYSTSGEAVPNGRVYAEETTNKKRTFAPVDGAGYYELGVNNGTWKVFGAADGYLDTQYSVSGAASAILVQGASQTAKNIKLTADANWSSRSKSGAIKPSSGGSIDDTDTSGTGVKITVPPQALGNSTANASLSVKDTSAVAETNSAIPFGGEGKEITATDNSGQPITSLQDYIDLEIILYKADVDAEVTAGRMIDKTKLKSMQVGYWDDTANNWVSLPTTRTAYYKVDASSTDWTMYADTATTTGYERFIDDALSASPAFTGYADYKLALKASTNHLSVFGAYRAKDSLLPSSPAGLTQASGSGASVSLSWNAVTTNTDSSSIIDLLGYQVYRSTDGSTYSQISTTTALTTYSDTGTTAWTGYYYKITASDDGGNETSLASSTALQVCSNKTISNGAVSASCSITCNSGYTQSGYTCVESGGGGAVIGGGSGDTAAPSISEIAVVPGNNQAIITWKTNESSLDWVAYGTSTVYGKEQKSATYITSHSVVLAGLLQGTTYHYQVKSKDSSGNVGSFTDKTFITLGEAPSTTPIVSPVSGPTPTTEAVKPISQMTVAEVRSEIARIATLIAQLQADLLTMSKVAEVSEIVIEAVPIDFTFKKNLKPGMVDEDVKYLQIVLNADPETLITSAGVGSPGKETNYFGSLTKAAVIKFQNKYRVSILAPYNLLQGTGLVGKTTREKLNELLSR